MYKVVIVEDEIIARRGIVETIDWKTLNCKIVCAAENGKLAFEYILANNVDLVITDIRMPVMDGLTLIQNTNKNVEHKIHFIVLTAFSEFEYAQKAIEMGVVNYILKPFKVDGLIASVKKAITRIEKNKIIEKQVLKENKYEIKNTDIMEKIITIDKISDITMRKVVQYIHHNYSNPDIMLQDLAEHAEVSQSHLSRAFSQYFDMSYQDYLTTYRLFKASYLLENTDLKIYEISKLAGYWDQKYFSSLFKKITSYTPLEYKNRHQGK